MRGSVQVVAGIAEDWSSGIVFVRLGEAVTREGHGENLSG